MIVMIDTNVILDLLLKRSPFEEDAYNVFKMADKGKIKANIIASGITDIYYLLNKKLKHETAITAIKMLFNMSQIVSVTKQDLEKAMSLQDFKDLEDALQMQCLKKIKAEYIITRDIEFQKLTPKAISPNEFINKHNKPQ